MDLINTKKRYWLSRLLRGRKLVGDVLDRTANAWFQNQDTSQALEQLKELDDHHLEDIGLSRSDLTPDGLSLASARRAAQQAEVSREIAQLLSKARRRKRRD